MAREEHDREDLLAEAKALVERVSLHFAGQDDEVVVGFRRDGCASVYFGAERAYHFNTANELRRAFADGLLYKADGGRLAALRRQRGEQAVELVRSDLDLAATRAFCGEMQQRLQSLHEAIAAGSFSVVGQVPVDSDVVSRVRGWLEVLPAEVRIAQSPRVG